MGWRGEGKFPRPFWLLCLWLPCALFLGMLQDPGLQGPHICHCPLQTPKYMGLAHGLRFCVESPSILVPMGAPVWGPLSRPPSAGPWFE